MHVLVMVPQKSFFNINFTSNTIFANTVACHISIYSSLLFIQIILIS